MQPCQRAPPCSPTPAGRWATCHVAGFQVTMQDLRAVLLQRLHAARHVQRHLQPLTQAAGRQAARAGAAVQPVGERAAAAGCGRGRPRLPLGRGGAGQHCAGHTRAAAPRPAHLSSSTMSQKSEGGCTQAAYSCMTCGWRSSARLSTSRTNVVACSRLCGCTRFTAHTLPRHVAWCTTPAGRAGWG